jgi:molybdopterin-containing oxidoreductase family iron-sulfur binding subunit
MEKCTYCVQRIRAAEHVALVDDRDLRADEVVTACQRACPTAAIVFGRLQDEDAPLDLSRRDPRGYAALAELGTRPRTRYLARVVNPREGT